jgi:hypothetical protein
MEELYRAHEVVESSVTGWAVGCDRPEDRRRRDQGDAGSTPASTGRRAGCSSTLLVSGRCGISARTSSPPRSVARRRVRWSTGGRGRGRSRRLTSRRWSRRRSRSGRPSSTTSRTLDWRSSDGPDPRLPLRRRLRHRRLGGEDGRAARGDEHEPLQLDHPELVVGERERHVVSCTGRRRWPSGCGSRTAASR